MTLVIVNTVAVCVLVVGLLAFFGAGLMFSRTYSLTDGGVLIFTGLITMSVGNVVLGIVVAMLGLFMCLIGVAAGEN